MYSQANICLEIKLPQHPNYTFDDDINVISYDNTTIAGNILVPKHPPSEKGFPAIIFVNSWVVEEHEYLIQAAQFAEKGYVVFSYSARGWGCSGGEVNVAGEKDIKDLSSIIDWLIANYPIDSQNIGISGISYGSGISLMGLAKEPRIKTAVAMSTWASLTDALYQQQTPRFFWGFLLVSSGLLTANMDPIIAQNYNNLLTNRNIPSTLSWAEERSVKNFVNLINERNAPVYLANSFGDNLFQANNLLKFFSRLSGPKRLDLNQGTHASAEGLGLLGFDNFTWRNTHRWFDYWLRGIETGIIQEPPVSTLTKVPAANQYYQRNFFENWPSNTIGEEEFHLLPRGLLSNGELSRQPYSSYWTKTNKIFSGLDTFATTGIPILSELLDGQLRTPVRTPLALINRANGIVFEGPRLSQTMKIRGIPKIKLNVRPSLKKLQLNAYLYDVHAGVGTLISHGPITLYNAERGQTQELEWEMVATAYDVPAGHKLAIAIDTFDALYAVPTLLPYSASFKFQRDLSSTLTLPVTR
ncbi:alpha/beta fold hydrolase [Agarilytica rhodophyticola]|uniref:alpha/beta fold hydrolase n=1 Tax=Agarilytica rhodophyticola TaxID=1737490 RepID=UPI001C1FC4E3|nr:alpha/beta fold hydrolase [Agarilytica rhodophyticola]